MSSEHFGNYLSDTDMQHILQNYNDNNYADGFLIKNKFRKFNIWFVNNWTVLLLLIFIFNIISMLITKNGNNQSVGEYIHNGVCDGLPLFVIINSYLILYDTIIIS